MPKRTSILALTLALLIPAILHAQTRQLHVACAADLEPVIPILAAEYQRATGVHLITSFGSSATLTQQLTNGAPQDVFLSADTAHPQHLIDLGVALGANPAHPSLPTPYARGVLVLWARKDSPAQPLSGDSLARAVKDPRITRLALANAVHAPYGLAAVDALRKLGLYNQLQPKFAIAENIAQTAEFAESGNAQLALISLTLATTPHFRRLGTFVRLPNVYPPIRQSAVILKSSKNKALAQNFLTWLTSPAIQQELNSFGLDPVK